jgi:hypothetical protein
VIRILDLPQRGWRIGANGGEGHSDPAMTLRRYAHVLEDMEDEGGRWTTSSRARVSLELPVSDES